MNDLQAIVTSMGALQAKVLAFTGTPELVKMSKLRLEITQK